MKDKYQNRYRIKSHRRPNWDYAGKGYYFLTLMVQNRMCYFGTIENDKMKPNLWGGIVVDEWFKSFEIRDELSCLEYVLMPNHIHAIVELNINNGRDTRPCVSIDKSQSGILHRKPKSISSFIAGFKSIVTSKINNWIDENSDIIKFNRKNHLWQPNYHDHIIRDQKSFDYISNYINNNPKNWDSDRFKNEK